jgi:alpha-tubulin suppressor-like RCC1 family protein
MSQPALALTVGGPAGPLTATVAPATASNKNVTWANSAPAVAQLSATTGENITVTALSNGATTITVTTADGNKTAICDVTVTTLVTGVTLDEEELELSVGDEHELAATVLPPTATNQVVVWSTSAAGVATVKDGLVTAVGAGEATITAASDENPEIFAACAVTVTKSVPRWTFSAGGQHTLAIKTDGTLWAWGYNANSRLGLGDTTNRNLPTQVTAAGDNWATVSAGAEHSAAIKEGGTLWTWGSNSQGQLGHNDTTARNVPTQVGDRDDWVAVSACTSFTLALRSDGTLWACGFAYYGMTGLGHNNTVRVFEQVADDGWAVIASANNYTSMAVKTDGSLWSWGRYASGNLGDGSTDNRNAPGRVGADIDWADAVAGADHSVGLGVHGGLWAWGSNNYGQLGVGTSTASHAYPEPVAGGRVWTAVTAGTNHTLAIADNGSLWSWGRNDAAQLGLDTPTSQTENTPRQVGDRTDWVAVSAGNTFSLALDADGTLWGFGQNTAYGQLGLGPSVPTGNQPRPIKISEGFRAPAK